MKSNSNKLLIAKFLFVGVSATVLATFLWPNQNHPQIPIGSQLDPNLGVEDPSAIQDAGLIQQEDHPVTDEMIKTAEELESKIAPDFSLPDETGKLHNLDSLTQGKKPLLIFFIEKKCPCCLGAKHFVDTLTDKYEKEATVIGVINASGKEAETWRKLTQPHFLVLEDPGQKAIRAYSAERGVYTTLISPDKKIVKAYPGYSLETLKEISAKIADLAGIPDKGFDSIAAPKKLTSGCLFPDPEPITNETP